MLLVLYLTMNNGVCGRVSETFGLQEDKIDIGEALSCLRIDAE